MTDVKSGVGAAPPLPEDKCDKCGKAKEGIAPKPEEVSRVVEEGQPKYQLKSGEEGLSVFAGMSDTAILGAAAWREGSSVETKKVSDIEAAELTLVQTHGDCDFLNEDGQDKHWEIRMAEGDTRNEFKAKLKSL